MWGSGWFKNNFPVLAKYLLGAKTAESPTQTDASETESTGTSGTSSVNQRGTQDASMQAALSETASQLSGASTVRTLFGSFSRKPTKVPGDDANTKVEEWLYDIKTFNQDAKDDIIQKAKEEQIKIQKELTRQEEYRQAKIEAESNRARTDRKAQKTAYSQATAKAEDAVAEAQIAAAEARIAAEKAREAPTSKPTTNPPDSFSLFSYIAKIMQFENRSTEKSPTEEASQRLIDRPQTTHENLNQYPQQQEQGILALLKQRTLSAQSKPGAGENGEVNQPPQQPKDEQTHVRFTPETKLGNEPRDTRTAWERERDEFMKKAEAGAVKRKEQIEASKQSTQQAKEAFWSRHNTFGFENPDLQEKRLLAYAQANGLNQTQTKVLRKRMGEENGLNYDKIIASRKGSSKDAKPDSSRVGNPPHPDGHAGLQNLTKKNKEVGEDNRAKEFERRKPLAKKPPTHQYGGYQTPSRPPRPIIPQPIPPSRTR